MFNKVLGHRITIFVFFLLIAALLGTKSDRYFGWTNDATKDGDAVLSDGSGYFAYLPQWFIYGTSNFEFQDSISNRYPQSRYNEGSYNNAKIGKRTNKYYCGTAICIAPFYLVSHVFASYKGYEKDGYSKPYMVAINIAAIAFFILGAIAIFLLLKELSIDYWIRYLLIAFLAFGTNISYYISILPSCSHIFSFGVVAWIVLLWYYWIHKRKTSTFLVLCFLIGLACIIRPTNILIVIFLLFVGKDLKSNILSIVNWIKSNKLSFLIGACIFGATIFIQLYQVHSQTGEWTFNTYTNEGFDNWNDPKWLEVLFSFDKGLFIFAPGLLLLIPGTYFLLKNQSSIGKGFILFFIGFTYVTSAWWCWWYGGGLGMRPYIDVLAILILPIAVLLQSVKWYVKIVLVIFLALSTKLYSIYELQMRYCILHYDRMTKEQFQSVFLKTDARYAWFLHIQYDTIPDNYQFSKRLLDLSDRKSLLKTNTLNTKSFNQYDSIALRYQLNLLLKLESENPFVQVNYFKDGNVIKKYDAFLGGFIDEINKQQKITIDIYPKLKWKEVDSIQISPLCNETHVLLKSTQLSEYIRK